MTADVTLLDQAAAERLTKRIELRLGTLADNLRDLEPLVRQARDSGAHEAMGYRSWPEYVTAEFGESLHRLAQFDRGPVIELLSSAGMSTRGIEAATGIPKSAVDRQVSQSGTPAESAKASACPTCKVSVHLPNPTCGNTDHDGGGMLGPAPSGGHTRPSRNVAGVDGKTYTRAEKRNDPERRKPRRRPLSDAYFHAVYDLEKAVNRLKRLHDDDRFAERHREALRNRHGGTVSAAASLLQEMVTELQRGGEPDRAAVCRVCGSLLLLASPGRDQCERCRLDAEAAR